MKRLDFGIIGFALLSLGAAMVLNGCNNDRTYEEYDTVESGDSLEITEQVILQCEQPFVFSVVSDYNTTVTIKTDEEEDTIHAGEFGVDIKYVVLSECNNTVCPEINTTAVIDPTKPINGNCSCGYELNDCATLCVKIETMKCGSGTEYNATTDSCEVLPPLECSIGNIDIEGVCTAKVYKLEEDECVNGYTEGKKGYFCFLDE